MEIKDAGTIIFTDLVTPNEAWVSIRYCEDWVGLAVFNDWKRVGPSERKEIEINMKPEDARGVLEALGAALEIEPPVLREVMREVAVIAFADTETGEETSIIVRHDASSVDLVMRNEDDGEVEVAMKRADAKALQEALKIAVRGE
jgi:hypothetical protein